MCAYTGVWNGATAAPLSDFPPTSACSPSVDIRPTGVATRYRKGHSLCRKGHAPRTPPASGADPESKNSSPIVKGEFDGRTELLGESIGRIDS